MLATVAEGRNWAFWNEDRGVERELIDEGPVGYSSIGPDRCRVERVDPDAWKQIAGCAGERDSVETLLRDPRRRMESHASANLRHVGGRRQSRHADHLAGAAKRRLEDRIGLIACAARTGAHVISPGQQGSPGWQVQRQFIPEQREPLALADDRQPRIAKRRQGLAEERP